MKRMREQADFDQGQHDTSKLHTMANYDQQEFSDRGRADMKIRRNDPRFSDNPMADERKGGGPGLLDEFIVNDSAVDRLHQMLTRVGITDQQIKGDFNLTQGGRMKVAARLGIGPDDVDAYLHTLQQRLRDETEQGEEGRLELLSSLREQYYNAINVIDEQGTAPNTATAPDDATADADDQSANQAGTPTQTRRSRFSMEPDVLGSVTVRDSRTGRSRFFQGAAATQLNNRLKSATDPDSVLAPMVEMAPMVESDGSLWPEIEADGGTYNFLWKIGNQHGSGTVMFHGRDPLKLVDVRDADGNQLESNPRMHRELLRQAHDFLGKE